MERVTNTYSENMGFSQEAVISKAGILLGSIIAVSYWANSLARGAFNCIKIGVRHASRCLPQGVSLKISRVGNVIGTSVSNSRFGSAILSFCSAHPAFVASLAILALVASNREIRGFVKTLLKLFLIDLPLVAFPLAFGFVKIVAEVAYKAVKSVWENGKFLARRMGELIKTLSVLFCKLSLVASWIAPAFVKILTWIVNFMWNHKNLTAGFIMGMGLAL